MSEPAAPYRLSGDDFPDLPVEHWERGMAEMADLLADELRQAQVDVPPALAGRLAWRICREFGGKSWYIPKGEKLERARRELTIYAEHDGTRHGPNGIVALAARHGLSEIYVYRLLDRQRELRRKQLQSELGL